MKDCPVCGTPGEVYQEGETWIARCTSCSFSRAGTTGEGAIWEWDSDLRHSMVSPLKLENLRVRVLELFRQSLRKEPIWDFVAYEGITNAMQVLKMANFNEEKETARLLWQDLNNALTNDILDAPRLPKYLREALQIVKLHETNVLGKEEASQFHSQATSYGNLTFFGANNQKVGSFDFGSIPAKFEGDADESARIFVEYIIKHFEYLKISSAKYTNDWLHCLLHVNPKTREIEFEGDQEIRNLFETAYKVED